MTATLISKVHAREVLDSKARPMVEVDVWTTTGVMGRGAAPCGTSVGSHEAFVLRDGGSRYAGMGVLKAVQNVKDVIGPALIGKDSCDQGGIDRLMVELDGTPDKHRLGANAIYSVSIAVARAGAASRELSLFRYLGGPEACRMPLPMFNMINGGATYGASCEFQEFMLAPVGATSFHEALRMGAEIYLKLPVAIAKRFGASAVRPGQAAGYAAPSSDPKQILETLLDAAEAAGYGGGCKLGLDCAATHFYDAQKMAYGYQEEWVSRDDLLGVIAELSRLLPLLLVEDPFMEDDFEGFAKITRELDLLVVGDDFLVTNLERLKKAAELGAGNGMILKPNMVGTLTEAMATSSYAKACGYCIIGSGRAGGGDDPVPEVAVAVGAPMVKFGAPRTWERISKQNCLLRIEEELGEAVVYAGGRDLLSRLKG
jgi:enolase